MAKTKNDQKLDLRLYVDGLNGRSRLSIANLEDLLNEHLPGLFDLEIINIQDDPEALEKDQIVATPTLIKRLPNPLTRLVGDFSNSDAVLSAMSLVGKVSA